MRRSSVRGQIKLWRMHKRQTVRDTHRRRRSAHPSAIGRAYKLCHDAWPATEHFLARARARTHTQAAYVEDANMLPGPACKARQRPFSVLGLQGGERVFRMSGHRNVFLRKHHAVCSSIPSSWRPRLSASKATARTLFDSSQICPSVCG